MTLRSHFLIQLSGAGLSALAFVVLTPLLVSSLGLERYGVLLLVLGFMIYTNLAELGIGVAVTREIAACEEGDRGRIFGNAILLSFVFAIVGGLLFASLALPTISSTFVEDPCILAELAGSVAALFSLGCLSILGGVPRGALFGLSNFVPLNIVSVFNSACSLLAPACYASFVGKELPGLIASVALANFATLVLSLTFCLKLGVVPNFKFNKKIARTLVSYGGWSTASGVLHRLTNSLDRLLISALIGPAAVPYFAIPEGALNRAHLVSSALLSAAFPRMVRSPYDEVLIELCYRGVLILTPFFIICIPLLKPALSLWLGTDFAESAQTPSIFLAVAIWTEIIGRVPYGLLGARSEMRVESRIAATILVPNLLLVILATYFFGVAGTAAIAIFRSSAFLGMRYLAAGQGITVAEPIIGNYISLIIAAISTIYFNSEGSYLILFLGIITAISFALYFNRIFLLSIVSSIFTSYINLSQ